MTATENTSSTSATSQRTTCYIHVNDMYVKYYMLKLLPLFDCRVLLRVRMLYYLKQEVIGEHADSILKGADIRYLFSTVTQESTQPNLASELLRAFLLILPCNHLFRDVDIWMPDMEQQEVPAGWWDGEADRSLLAGVFKHGIFYFNLS